jgi:hypothetical protein
LLVKCDRVCVQQLSLYFGFRGAVCALLPNLRVARLTVTSVGDLGRSACGKCVGTAAVVWTKADRLGKRLSAQGTSGDGRRGGNLHLIPIENS